MTASRWLSPLRMLTLPDGSACQAAFERCLAETGRRGILMPRRWLSQAAIEPLTKLPEPIVCPWLDWTGTVYAANQDHALTCLRAGEAVILFLVELARAAEVRP